MFFRIINRIQPCTSQQRLLSRSPALQNSLLQQFFDDEENFGKQELRAKKRPGRSWTNEELRLKSSEDLHKLWYVCLKERNMLLTMEKAHKATARHFPNPERLDRVKGTLKNIEEVVHERNDAYYQLETGDSASAPKRTVTSFMGFTYEKRAEEHYSPPGEGQKGYEVPYLDDDAYLMQKLWNEKELCKERDRKDNLARRQLANDEMKHYKRGGRRTFDRLEDLKVYQ
ncbi:unnamed protein product, partial [Mesorhabditis belari]|uniref:Large ribosomal subunit protein uL29m n=1 Tax=Mesorhabditis belari TaxID=2138241 RepID=A0AAF3F4L8_9BILA